MRLDVCLGQTLNVHQTQDGLWFCALEPQFVTCRLEARVEFLGPDKPAFWLSRAGVDGDGMPYGSCRVKGRASDALFEAGV